MPAPMVLGVTARTAFVRRALPPARPAPAVRRCGRRATWAMLLLLASGGLVSLACDKVTSDNIALWKTTEKGPGKLAEALHDRSLEPKLRAEAAVALVDLGKPEEVESTLSGMPAGERWELMKTVIPALQAAMTGASGPEKALGYRDALFSLRALASAEDQARIDATLLPGIEAALRSGRIPNGRHSVEKILLAVGTPAGAMLAKLLGEPIANYAAVADLLARVGDEGARAAGGAALVARAGRQKPVPDATWKALGLLGGPAAVKFLEDTIEHGARDDARSAVRALQQRREPQILPLALKVAGDPGADPAVRDEMFGVIEVIGGPQAEAGLLNIISTDRQEIVRYRAFESALAIGKAKAVVPALEAFPLLVPYKKGDVDDLLVKLIEKLGAAARPPLLKALDSKIPLARMAAVMSLEQLGQPPDTAVLEALAKDTTMIKGFPGGETVGKEATRVAAALRSKG